MEMTTIDNAAPGAGGRQKFVINMLAYPMARPQVRSCEVVGDHVRQRASFTRDCEVEKVFDNRLAEQLLACLERLEDGVGVLSLPELLIEIEGVVLAGVHVMVRQLEDGERAVIFRFRNFVGFMQRLFHPRLALTDPVVETSERLALGILCDVGMPLLDIIAAEEVNMLAPEHRGCLPDKLFANAHELRFRLELIKRYLAALDDTQTVRGAPPITIDATWQGAHLPQ